MPHLCALFKHLQIFREAPRSRIIKCFMLCTAALCSLVTSHPLVEHRGHRAIRKAEETASTNVKQVCSNDVEKD